jgi:hypothetical protein
VSLRTILPHASIALTISMLGCVDDAGHALRLELEAEAISGAAGSDAHAAHVAAGGRAIELPMGQPGSSIPRMGLSSEIPRAGDGTGAFRTVCEYSHMNYDDPLLYPSQSGKAHLHAYFGNTKADATSTTHLLRTTGNSTCRGGTVNRTAYWVPALFDASGRPIAPDRLEIYYKTGYRGVAPSAVRAFPSGLRMIAGDAKSAGPQRDAYWGCRENYVGHSGSIPNCPAGDSLVMSVELPQCWDGKNLDSPDHKSHMAYASATGCPSTHPVPIPAITMNVVYARTAGDHTGWRLASDNYSASQPGGFSAHADWMEAWTRSIVQAFVRNCLNAAVDCKSHLLGDGRTLE